MKSITAFLILFFFSINALSQKIFFIEIQDSASINCGDSTTLVVDLISPVSFSFTHSYAATDFEFNIVDKKSDTLVKKLIFHNVISVDTSFFLKSGLYYLKGTVVPDILSITGSIGDWTFGDVEYQLEFKIDTLVDSKNIYYRCLNKNYLVNTFKIAPNNTAYIPVFANYIDGSVAKDSIYIEVNPLTLNIGLDKFIVCGDSIEFDTLVTNYTGTGGLIYSWFPETGLNNPNIAQPIAKITSNETYLLTLTTQNGCTAEDDVKVTVIPLIASVTDANISCGEIAQLNVNTNLGSNNSLIYDWSPKEFLNDANISNPEAMISKPTAFSVVVATPNGCIDSTVLYVNISSLSYKPEICLVSVDSSSHNMIIWNQLSNSPFDSIFIYKETAQSNIYEKISSKSTEALSIFIDSLSNPAQNSSRYRISLLDSCGYETLLSNYHKTIHLTINTGIGGAWNLIWDGYQGFDYSTYHIYRGTTDNNLLKIAEQASNTFTFTDLVPPIGTVYYQIEVENLNICSIGNLKSISENYSYTRSNIVSSSQVYFIEGLSTENIEIFPNPANNEIHIYSDYKSEYFNLSISTLDGKILINKQNLKFNSEIDITALDSGMYLVVIVNKKNIIYKKLIKR